MTDYYLGKREQIAICPEATYGSLGGNSMASNGYIPGLNIVITPDFAQDWQEVLQTGSDSLEVASFQPSVHMYPFQMQLVVTDWRFLKYCGFGTVGNTGGPTYTHTFALANAVASFTMEWAKRSTSGGNEVITMTGCVIKKITLKWVTGTGAAQGFITALCDCVGQSIAIGTSITTVSANTSTAFQFRHVKYTFETTEIKEVNNGEFVIDTGIDESKSRYANSTVNQNIFEPIITVMRYNTRININYNANTYSTAFNTDAALTGTNTLTFTVSATDKIVFTWTNAVLKQVKGPTNIDGIDNIDLIMLVTSLAPTATDLIGTY